MYYAMPMCPFQGIRHRAGCSVHGAICQQVGDAHLVDPLQGWLRGLRGLVARVRRGQLEDVQEHCLVLDRHLARYWWVCVVFLEFVVFARSWTIFWG